MEDVQVASFSEPHLRAALAVAQAVAAAAVVSSERSEFAEKEAELVALKISSSRGPLHQP